MPVGVRATLTVGGAVFAVAGLYLATRPPFLMLVLVQLITGYGTGVLESVLNAYLTALPGATTPLNRLHAFFGVGALVGPALAAWIVSLTSWTAVWLMLAAACVPLTAGFLVAFPGRQAADLGDVGAPADRRHPGCAPVRRLVAASPCPRN